MGFTIEVLGWEKHANHIYPEAVMLTRPQPYEAVTHEADGVIHKAEAKTHEAKARYFFLEGRP